MKNVKTYLTKNQYQKDFFDLYGYNSPFISKEEEEADKKSWEEAILSDQQKELILKAIEMRLAEFKSINDN